jgi:hypothetical protein
MRFIAWEIEEKQFMLSLIESLAYAKEIKINFIVLLCYLCLNCVVDMFKELS